MDFEFIEQEVKDASRAHNSFNYHNVAMSPKTFQITFVHFSLITYNKKIHNREI